MTDTRHAQPPQDHPQLTSMIDPRLGDIEADALSTKKRTMLSLAGNFLVEISFPKLLTVWALLIAMPALVLGIAPLIGAAWLTKLFSSLTNSYAGLWSLLILVALPCLGWLLKRPLRRAVEQGFWSLNSIAVLPTYALFREGTRHLLELTFAKRLNDERRARLRAASAAVAGIALCIVSLLIILMLWPWTRWTGQLAYLVTPHHLIVPTLANATVIVSTFCACAALVWGLADATMDQPQTLSEFGQKVGRKWRIAHLSDIHVVGERYGFRLESGRSGPRGNDRLTQVMARLAEIHEREPLDHILITGDITDTGRSPEWAEFMDTLTEYPHLAARVLLLPGNHDINVADRSNPARLEMPTSSGRLLREMRTLSAIAAVQANRVRVIDTLTGRLGCSLEQALSPHQSAILALADTGKLWGTGELKNLWETAFPMVQPPDGDNGLGIVLLNSTAQTHFSFTNALGLISSEQSSALYDLVQEFPKASWIIALHHHLIEYPGLSNAFSERIGTALINGSWFVRQLQQLGSNIIVMHGHRHIDWIGRCGHTRIVSAPSPVMEDTGDDMTYFYIHTLGLDDTGALQLLPPERIDIPGSPLI